MHWTLGSELRADVAPAMGSSQAPKSHWMLDMMLRPLTPNPIVTSGIAGKMQMMSTCQSAPGIADLEAKMRGEWGYCLPSARPVVTLADLYPPPCYQSHSQAHAGVRECASEGEIGPLKGYQAQTGEKEKGAGGSERESSRGGDRAWGSREEAGRLVAACAGSAEDRALSGGERGCMTVGTCCSKVFHPHCHTVLTLPQICRFALAGSPCIPFTSLMPLPLSTLPSPHSPIPLPPSPRQHPHALADVAVCALRGQPAALYVLEKRIAALAAPAAPAAPAIPAPSPQDFLFHKKPQERRPASGGFSPAYLGSGQQEARVARGVQRRGMEELVLGEMVADGHVYRRLHCLAASLQAPPAAADAAAAAAAWGMPRVPADLEGQLSSVPCPLAECRMVQQAVDSGSAGGSRYGGGGVGRDGDWREREEGSGYGSDGEGSDWDSESEELWGPGWTGGESDDESEGEEESAWGKDRQHHGRGSLRGTAAGAAVARARLGEQRSEGSAVRAGGAGAGGAGAGGAGAGGAGAGGAGAVDPSDARAAGAGGAGGAFGSVLAEDGAVLRGFGRALSLILAQYEAGITHVAKACVAAISASPGASASAQRLARSQVAAPGRAAAAAAAVDGIAAGAAPRASDALPLLAIWTSPLREQLRRLVLQLGMEATEGESGAGDESGKARVEQAGGGWGIGDDGRGDAWSMMYQFPQAVTPPVSSTHGMPLTPGTRGMLLTPAAHGMPLTPGTRGMLLTPAAHGMPLTPGTHAMDHAYASSSGSRGMRARAPTRSSKAAALLSSLHNTLKLTTAHADSTTNTIRITSASSSSSTSRQRQRPAGGSGGEPWVEAVRWLFLSSCRPLVCHLHRTMASGDLPALLPLKPHASAAAAAAASGVAGSLQTPLQMVTPSCMVTPARAVTPSRGITHSRGLTASQVRSPAPVCPSPYTPCAAPGTPHFLSALTAGGGDARSTTHFPQPNKINYLLPSFLHPVSHLVVRTAQQQAILLSAPSPPVRQLVRRLSSLLSSLFLPHSHPLPSLSPNGKKSGHVLTVLASDWSIDFTLAGVARTREAIQHRLAEAELQVRELLDALEPRSGAEEVVRIADVDHVVPRQIGVPGGVLLAVAEVGAVEGTSTAEAAVTGTESFAADVAGVAAGGLAAAVAASTPLRPPPGAAWLASSHAAKAGQALGREGEEADRGHGGKDRGSEQICSACGWSHDPSWHAPGDDVAAADWPWKGTHPPPLSSLLAPVHAFKTLPEHSASVTTAAAKPASAPDISDTTFPSPTAPSPTSPSATLQQARLECTAMMRLTDPRSGPAFPWTWMACKEDACHGDASGGGVLHGVGGISWHAVLQHALKHGGGVGIHALGHGSDVGIHALGHGTAGQSACGGRVEGSDGEPQQEHDGLKEKTQAGEKGEEKGGETGAKKGGQKGAAAGNGRREEKGVEWHGGNQGGKQGGHGGAAAAARGDGSVTDEERRLMGLSGTERDGSFNDVVDAHMLLPIRASHTVVSRAMVHLLLSTGRYREHCAALRRLFLSHHSNLPSALLHALHSVNWASLRTLTEQQHALSSAVDSAISRGCLSSLASSASSATSSSPSPLHAFIAPSSLASSRSSLSPSPAHPASAVPGLLGVGSTSKRLTWSPLSAHRLDAFDFVRLRYDPGWPASAVITPEVVQQYGETLTALMRLHLVQRAVGSVTIHIKTLRSALVQPAKPAAGAGRSLHRERYRRLCFLNVFTIRASHLVSGTLAFMSAQLQRAALLADKMLLLCPQPSKPEQGHPQDLLSFQEAHAQFLLYCRTSS
ncbi:hypothetical protein CLOM_g12579 [Closterium sp. NIES-68]|nr:hypothetical protein CLOM_g12579 [Closterium sp. NIES-68]